ncbi:prephenate dehydrogenase/arogenate dehydrogenase family protein [candidate division KSB1 bacterium]|nr:prephenate dehydrogenase/arogenate dehydrogenase family protein [candidate division KSB1 bacterium]
MSRIQSVGIAGLGLIGGSIGLAVRKQLPRVECLGFDISSAVMQAALERGAVHCVVASLAELRTELIVVAVPLRQAAEVTREFLRLHAAATIVDVASVKASLLPLTAEAAAHRLILTHPMSGKEVGGIANAEAELFRGRNWVICGHDAADKERAQAVTQWISELGAVVREIPLGLHDSIVARTSHLPQVLSTLLAAQLQSLDAGLARGLSGTGLESMTRLAGSDWELWRDIYQHNRLEIDTALREFGARLSATESTLAGAFASANAFYRQSRTGTTPDSSRELEVEVDALATTGDGVAHTTSGAVFISGALPGDRVAIEYTPGQRGANAKLLRLVQPSPHRVAHPCPHHHECNASPWGGLEYTIQLEQKRDLVHRTLRKLMGEVEIRPTVPSPQRWGYRQRITPAIWLDEGRLAVGFRAEARATRGVALAECSLALPAVSRALSALAARLRELDPARLESTPKRIQIHATRDGAGAVLVFPGGCDARSHRAWESRLELPELSGGIWTVRGNSAGIPNSSLAGFTPGRSHPMLTRHGADPIELPPLAFCQVNAAAAELVHARIAERFTTERLSRIWDLYGGYGALGIAASAGRCPVTVAEQSAHSRTAFMEFAERRGITGPDFVPGDLRDTINSFAARIGGGDLVILDPPASGVHPAILERLLKSPVRRICYLSCNPARLGRDLRVLTSSGFHPVEITPFDFFPQTASIEVLALLER